MKPTLPVVALLGAVVTALLAVGSSPAVASQPELPEAPTAYHLYVAVMDNDGGAGITDDAIRAAVQTAGQDASQAAGDRLTPLTVTLEHYTSRVAAKHGFDCLTTATASCLHEVAVRVFPHATVGAIVLWQPAQAVATARVRGWSGNAVVASGQRPASDLAPSIAAAIAPAGTAFTEFVACHATSPATCTTSYDGTPFSNSPSNAHCAGTECRGGTWLSGWVAPGEAERWQAGLTQPGELRDLALPATSSTVTQTVTLQPVGDDSGLRALRVTDPNTGARYYLQYRSGTGADAGAAYADADSSWTMPGYGDSYLTIDGGVGLVVEGAYPRDNAFGHLSEPGYYTNTVSSPDDEGYGAARAIFAAGETYRSANGTISATVDSADPVAGLQVTVTVESSLPPITAKLPTWRWRGAAVVGGAADVVRSGKLPRGMKATGACEGPCWDLRDSPEMLPSTILRRVDAFPRVSDLGKRLVWRTVVTMRGHRATVRTTSSAKVRWGTLTICQDCRGVVGGDVLAGDLSGPSGDVDQNPGVHITWAWLRDGQVIPGATSWLYSTTSADVGRHLAARETVMWAGHRKVLTSKGYPVVG